MKKTITIDQILTPVELERAAELYKTLAGTGKFAAAVDAELITPNIAHIDRALGQENYPRYLAYAVEFALSQVHTKGGKNGN